MGCSLIPGVFGIFVQAFLFFMACATLLYKKKRDPPPQRTWPVFLRDSSKQIAGAAFIHLMNLTFAEALESRFKTNADACDWYWVNIVVDCTLGVGVSWAYLKICMTVVVPLLCKSTAHEYESGNYGHEGGPVCRRYTKQILLWLGVVFCMKVTMVIVMGIGHTFWLAMASLVLHSFSQSPDLKLVVVMVITPTVFNAVQFWLQDNFLKKPQDQEVLTVVSEMRSARPSAESFQGSMQ
eukprot:CAMPEP_0204357986 /NCGR_PEP_ID=MMETSP0469-20131031/36191_1 /ASSEMBLY_ACC=CAM_ASM_000384 /TAXON_ID=2969 /ORGANISM="Oxyrrhis marina" /LENGTH=237 /DNA_ID=CAMNT_0051345777 /DNA_START=30 /DNA_END=743 /DNA_ORIENTATION=-